MNDVLPNIADPALRAQLRARFATRVVITPAVAAQVTELTIEHVGNERVGSLAGLQAFTGLIQLTVSAQSLTELDVRPFRQLRELDCGYNDLTILRLSGLQDLRVLACSNNALTQLDLDDLPALEHLDCSFNPLGRLQLSQRVALRELTCAHAGLTQLDLSHCRKLSLLNACTNRLSVLDLSGLQQLTSLDCAGNALIELDLRGVPQLQTLRCHHNAIGALSLAAVPQLRDLRCFNNDLTALDLSHTPALHTLYCSDNQLTALDLSVCLDLSDVGYGNNPIPPVVVKIRGAGSWTSTCGSEFTARRRVAGNHLYLHTDTNDAQVLRDLGPWLVDTLRNAEALDRAARAHITAQSQAQEASHASPEVSEPEWTGMQFGADRTLALQYDAGDSPAGRLFISVHWDADGCLVHELVFDVY